MSTRKSVIFSLILVFLGLFVIELLTRGAFRLYGRYDTWGYQTKNVEFRPYIGFASSPYDGGTDRYGFKLDSNDDPERNLEIKDDCEFRIFLLGGSTVAGRFPDSPEDTLSFRLEQLLIEQFPEGISFSVINAGKGGYISVQTVLQHALYIKYSLKPDFVVHFDGSNDSVGSPANWPKGTYLGLRDNIHSHTEQVFSKINSMSTFRGILNATLRNLANYSAFVFALHKTINTPSVWRRKMLDVDILQEGDIEITEWVDRHVNRYIYNVKLAASFGDQNTGVAYFFQPTMLLYMKDLLSSREKLFLNLSDYPTDFHGFPLWESKQLFYFRVREELEKFSANNRPEFSTIADLSKLFDNKSPTDQYFGDHVHYTGEARVVIANAIANIIESKIQKQILVSQRFSQCGM